MLLLFSALFRSVNYIEIANNCRLKETEISVLLLKVNFTDGSIVLYRQKHDMCQAQPSQGKIMLEYYSN